MPALLLLLLAASISTDFEGGCLGKIEKVTDTHYRLAAKGETDQDHRNRQANWYSFRVDNATQPLTLDIVNLPGEYNYQPNRGAITKDTPPVISYDGKTWQHVTTFEYDPAEPKLVLHITPTAKRFWIAHTPPYTNETLAKLRAEIHANPDFHEEIIGKTVGGRDLVLWTISHGSPAPDRPVIWLFFRQHSWETGSSWAGEGAIRALIANQALREKAIWKIYPLCDPDGVARGGVRFNVNGFDLNRNWDVVDPVKMPEITAQRKAIKAWLDAGHHIDFLLSLHNTETGEYLEGPPDKFKPLAERVFKALSDTTTFAPTRPLSYAAVTTTAGKPGRMNVSQGLYHDFQLPAFIMEQRISMNTKLGHLPGIPDRLHFGEQLVTALSTAVR